MTHTTTTLQFDFPFSSMTQLLVSQLQPPEVDSSKDSKV